MEERLHGEVGPAQFGLTAKAPVAPVVFIKAVFGVAAFRKGFVFHLFLLLRLASLGDGLVPKRGIVIDFLQLFLVALNHRFVVGGSHHCGNGLDAGGDGIHVLGSVQKDVGVPDDEILFLHLLELGLGGEVTVGVFLGVAFRDGLD